MYSSVFVAGIMIDVFNVVVFVVGCVGRCVVDVSGVVVDVFAVIVVAVVIVVVVFVSVCAIGDFPNDAALAVVAVFACPVLAFVIFDDVVIIFVVFVVVVEVIEPGAIFDVPKSHSS